jgi:hypothetical protein
MPWLNECWWRRHSKRPSARFELHSMEGVLRRFLATADAVMREAARNVLHASG